MPIAVLSPCVLKVKPELSPAEELLHYSKLAELLQKLWLYTNLKFQYYRKAPYDGYKMEIPEYTHNFALNNHVAVNVYGVIQKMLMDGYIDLTSIAPATPPATFSLPNGKLSEVFCSYINYLCEKDAMLFISEDNFCVSRPIEFYSDKPFRINTSTYISVEFTDILLPYLKDISNVDDIFPRADFCSNYNNYVTYEIQNKKLPQPQKIALYQQIGSVVAKYNIYEKNRHLSRLNSTPHKLRTVYKKVAGEIFYLSFDVESGGFEVFNNNFEHLGQYNFSCEQVKPPSPTTHTLKH